MTLIQYCYLSASAETPVTHARLAEILAVSRRNNTADGITGILVSLDDIFLQILEGDRPKVAACLSRIRLDPRHIGVHTVYDEPVEARAFPDWAMAHAPLGGQAIGEGAIDVRRLSERLKPHKAELGRAYTILESFCRARADDPIRLPG